MVGVYRITNKLTGDCYVGQSKHIEERWKEHFCKSYGARHSGKFQNAINKYGKDGFTFEILEECPKSMLFEKERFYIELLKPTYNTIVLGHPVALSTREKIRQALQDRKQPLELVEKRRKAILERHKTIPQTNQSHKKPIRIELNNKSIELESVLATAKYLGVDPSTVTKALKRHGRVRGYKVRYAV